MLAHLSQSGLARSVPPCVLVSLVFTITPVCQAQTTKASPADGFAGISQFDELLKQADKQSSHVTGQADATRRIQAEEVEAVQLILGELHEQVQVASTKLTADMLARKRRMGKLQSLVNATDRQITRMSATITRLTERRRRLLPRQQASSETAASASATGPIGRARDQRERLSKYHVQLQQELKQLRQEHLDELLSVSVRNIVDDDALGVNDFATFVEQQLHVNRPDSQKDQ